MKVKNLKANPENPRTITDAKLLQLKRSMERFGDLSGIVFNRRSGNLGGGHQRAKNLTPAAKVVITKSFAKPTKQGTVAHGYVLEGGERWSYREVDWDAATEKAANLAANKQAGNWDMAKVGEWFKELGNFDLDFDLDLTMFDAEERAGFFPTIVGEHERNAAGEAAELNLKDRFLVAPFSVLNAREGWWQNRKQAWIGIGLKSELGRDAAPGGSARPLDRGWAKDHPKKGVKKKAQNAAEWVKDKGLKGLSGKANPTNKENIPGYYYKIKQGMSPEQIVKEYEAQGLLTSGTSIFDPVLCEIVYRWFCPAQGLVIDPFAGGSVRGVVASRLGKRYLGVELRAEQVEANIVQGKELCKKPMPKWLCDTSENIPELVGEEADLVFSCPPYADLEVYSDDPRDISNKKYDEFLPIYRDIVAKSIARLKDDRFAVFVVGEVREKKGGGFYYGFVQDTIRAFGDAGARLYNEAILITSVGSLPIRMARPFKSARKLGKTHQNVLVFCKGDPRKAAEACGDVEIPDEDFLTAAGGGEIAPPALSDSEYGEVMQ